MIQQEKIVQWLSLAVLALMAVTLCANMLLMMRVERQVNALSSCRVAGNTIPLAGIPMRLITESPICAQKLLELMNVTNVRIPTNASQLPGLDDRTVAQLRNVGYRYPAPAEPKNRPPMNKTDRQQ